jgi:adenylate cyclase
MANVRLGEEGQETARPSSDEVRAYFGVLLARGEFDASERNRRFLSYVVEETLEGRADRIKAYNIALAAFGRSDDFDPLTDPIVRIEAARLRRSLEYYYLTAGKSDQIRIDIPKGSYSATFEYTHEPALQSPTQPVAPDPGANVEEDSKPAAGPERRRRWYAVTILAALALFAAGIVAYIFVEQGQQTGSMAADSRGPAILIKPFEFVGSDPGQSYLARGLTYQVIGTLTRFDDLFVYGSETSFGVEKAGGSSELEGGVTPDYVLSGSVQTGNSKVRVSAILSDAKTSQYLWSSTTEGGLNTSGLMQVQSEIAMHVAAAVAQPYGFVFEQKLKDIGTKPANDLVSYECVVRFRQYWSSYSDRDFGGVRACLERSIATDPYYARAHSSLALLYIDTYRFGFEASTVPFDPLRRAVELADKAIDLAPNASNGYLAKSMALWFLHDVEGSIQTARRGLEINPYDTDLLADLGLRLAQRAKWDEAMPLIQEAYARNPGAPVGYHIATFLHQYMTGNYQAALESAKKVRTPSVLYGAVARAMAYAQLGRMAEAREAVAEILAIDPHYADHVGEDLAKRNHVPQIIEAIVDGLDKAGLRAGSRSKN